jgi:long-chain acyl-CoA synthetase
MSERLSLPADFKLPLETFYHWEQTQSETVWLRQSTDQGWDDYSWRAVGDQARRMANALQKMGLQAGDKVGIYGVNSAYWVIADLAIMMAGLVSVPIYPSMPEDKIRFVVEHSDMKALFADHRSAMNLPQLTQAFGDTVELITMGGQQKQGAEAGYLLWSDIQANTNPLTGNPTRALDDLWTIGYTSGTTGVPKGVMHSFSSLPSSASEIERLSTTTTESRFFSYLPLANVAERTLVFLQALYRGGSIAFNSSKENFIKELQQIRPTFFFAVPRIWVNLKAGIITQLGAEAWQQFIDNPKGSKGMGPAILESLGLDAVNFAFSGAAPIAPTDILAWNRLGMPLFEGFGQSETMSVTLNLPGAVKVGSVGKCVTDGAEMKISEQGEILLRSPGNMLGYYKEPEKTAEAFDNGWIRTGDKGVIDDQGFLTITGRIKEIFKTAKGKYVAPAPIEKRMGANTYIDQLCLVGSGQVQTMLLLVPSASALAVKREQVNASLQTLMEEINACLETHERMSHIIVCSKPWSIENNLLTHTLKIMRDDVEVRYGAIIEQCANGTQPSPVVWETDCDISQ